MNSVLRKTSCAGSSIQRLEPVIDGIFGHGFTGKFVDETSAMHHQHTIAVLHQLGHIVGNHQDGEPFITGKLADDIVDLRLGADIDADGWPVEDQDFAPVKSQRASTTRCALPPDR